MTESKQVRMEIRVDLEPGKIVLTFDRTCDAVQMTPHDARGIALALVGAACWIEVNEEEAAEAITH